ncbi:hypothetical protein ACQEUX_12390 [Micromonospora sp. CA-259024]|uniref:hypothetical protein n=1 Tax=Micromonospora sp. CA-259024 TaxID=3239965 RepID=UPI003D94BECF
MNNLAGEALLLNVLNIGASPYHAWVKQAEQPCDRDLVDLGLISNIHEMVAQVQVDLAWVPTLPACG